MKHGMLIAAGGFMVTVLTGVLGLFEWRLRQQAAASDAAARQIAREEDEVIWRVTREDHALIRADIAALKQDMREMILRMRDQLRAELGK